jgi:hypothetical protein
MLALTIGMMLAAAQAPAETEAQALGRRLSEAGLLGSLLPMMTAKETDEMVAARPELSAAEQARLRAIAAARAQAGMARLFKAEGDAYAARLSVAELKALVAFHESPAARRQRAVMPDVIAATMQSVGAIDFKGETLAAFCKETGKACEKD